MGPIVRKIESIELSLNQRQIQLRQSGLTKKEQQASHQASRRNSILACLKLKGTPFTCESDTNEYIEKEKDHLKCQKRLMRFFTFGIQVGHCHGDQFYLKS